MNLRLVLGIASGALVAAGLAACGEEPSAASAENGPGQALARAPAPAPNAAAPAVAQADENAALAGRVVAALRRDPAVARLGIDVVSVDGAVTLFGTAPTAGERERAARVAAGVDGVKSVTNNLVIVAGS